MAGPPAALTAPPFREAARRITTTLLAAQSLGSAGFLAASTVSAIVGAQLSGRPSWAGVPSAVYQFGAALAAVGWGQAMDRLGRRLMLAVGLLCGITGASLAGGAVVLSSFWTLLAGLGLMGAANSALWLARFVAAEVHPPAERGRAIANVVIGGTVGAILGPLLTGPSGRAARALGVDELAGPYAVSAALFLVAALLVLVRLRPDPREIGREVARVYASDTGGAATGARPLGLILRQRPVRAAMATLALSQVVMVMLMVITSLHMKDHHHPLGSIAAVISSHVVGMYAFSVVSGRLADRWGRGPVIGAGAVALVLACVTAPLSPAAVPLGLSLFLLGLGWNFCYVGGSALLADQLAPAERARAQAFNDFVMGAASATGSLGSGWVFATVGYGAMGLVAALAALVPFVLAWRLPRPPSPQPSPRRDAGAPAG